MKNVLMAIALCAAVEYDSINTPVNFQDALESNLIKAEILSAGGHNGFCLTIKMRNNTPKSMFIIVKAGTKFNSLEDSNQDLIVVKDCVLYLKQKENKNITVKSYCCQQSKRSPMRGAKYKVVNGDSSLRSIAVYLSQHNFAPSVEQHAIWAVSDRGPLGAVGSTADNSQVTLRKFLCGLRNEVMPWYDLHSHIYQYSNGIIDASPYLLTGEHKYSIATSEFGKLTVKDTVGRPVALIQEQWLTEGNDKSFPLSIPLKNLKTGKYIIELNTASKTLFKKEFVL